MSTAVNTWVNWSMARAGLTSAEHAEINRLKGENAELRCANEILKAASAYSAAELDRRQPRS